MYNKKVIKHYYCSCKRRWSYIEV